MPDISLCRWLLLVVPVAVFAISLAALIWASVTARALERIFGSPDQKGGPPCGSAS